MLQDFTILKRLSFLAKKIFLDYRITGHATRYYDFATLFGLQCRVIRTKESKGE